jgi:hypothetical protein
MGIEEEQAISLLQHAFTVQNLLKFPVQWTRAPGIQTFAVRNIKCYFESSLSWRDRRYKIRTCVPAKIYQTFLCFSRNLLWREPD